MRCITLAHQQQLQQQAMLQAATAQQRMKEWNL
jgi:hypothetical protein